MYSKVKIAGHPVHPMFVAFPIAFYVASCAAYIYYGATGADPFWFRLAYVANVAGVLTALVAAIPGFIDWSMGIPQGTPAKKTGLYHMLLNVSALALFAINAWINSSQYRSVTPTVGWAITLSVFGVGFTMISGFLGWNMIGTHHVGVDLTPEQERIDPDAVIPRPLRKEGLRSAGDESRRNFP